MTFLRYFIPLIIEGNKRGIKSNIYGRRSGKYNCVYKEVNSRVLHLLSTKFNFEIFNIEQINECKGPIFLIEGVGIECIEKMDNKRISMVYMTDFIFLYEKYVDKVDHVVFPSRFIAEYYDKLSDKNLYLGTSKYDFLEKDRSRILSEHQLPDEKFVLIVFPRNRDLAKIDLQKIYGFLTVLGYKTLVKTRGKDPVHDPKNRGDYYYMDYSWYPHDTMDLIQISDFVINFGSTTVKESVILKTPLIDFDIKPKSVIRGYDFLYDYDYCRVLQPSITLRGFAQVVESITSLDEDVFDVALQNHLFAGNSSERILDFIN